MLYEHVREVVRKIVDFLVRAPRAGALTPAERRLVYSRWLDLPLGFESQRTRLLQDL